jgi:hypothetical protein
MPYLEFKPVLVYGILELNWDEVLHPGDVDNLGLEYFATDVRKGELIRAIYGISLGIEPGTCLEETNLPEDTCEQIEKLYRVLQGQNRDVELGVFLGVSGDYEIKKYFYNLK